jgi:MFS family permease
MQMRLYSDDPVSSCDFNTHLGPLLGYVKMGGQEVKFNKRPKLGSGERLFVFISFTQLAQGLMSYDGGATQMSTQPLLKSGWSSAELGLLGAMDKFGQVATAFMWSHLLMRFNNKVLLSLGLFSKAASCLGFGLLQRKLLMLLSKLGMGVSEALIGVWATVWVQKHAPLDSQARWLGFAAISAGVGNGMGSAVAGLCSEKLGYAFAFEFQAGLLFCLFLVMMCCPGRFFQLQDDYEDQRLVDSDADLDNQDHDVTLPLSFSLNRSADEAWETGTASTMAGELTTVVQSQLWLYSALCISLICFISSVVAYLWQNTTESVFGFNDVQAYQDCK